MSQNPTDNMNDPGAIDPALVNNPYVNAARAEPVPDLDAAAPQLRVEENQRMNRKALMFLGLLILLVLGMAWLMLGRSSKEADKPTAAPREERPYIPDSPTVARMPALPPPAEPMPMVPPLPLAEPMPMAMDDGGMGSMPSAPRGPTLLSRRIDDAGGMQTGAGMPADYGMGQMPGQMGMPGSDATIQAQLKDVGQAGFLHRRDTLLQRGTYIRCVLETRVVTDHPGFTSCIVTEPVYSTTGQTLLLPRGSKVFGSYSGAMTDRVQVIWDRITTPNGVDVQMSSPGVDGLGGAGHPGDLDNHWGQKISAALLISLVADGFKYAAAEHGPAEYEVGANGTIVSTPYESATARTMENMANQVLNQQLNRRPTVTINQGTVVNVYVARDVDFSSVVANLRR
ncbi:MAG: TrbI/VirB10 family protein [Stenotrophomonas sp.]